MTEPKLDVATAAGIILIIISLPVATVAGLSNAWHKSRCHAVAQKVFPPRTILAVDYRASELFSGPTECEFTLGYREPGFGACWIWVDRIRAWNHLSGCYTQPPTTDTQREAAQSWAADITHDGELFRITVP